MKEHLLKEIQFIAQGHSLPGWEVPVDILLEPHPFSVENGLLTSTLKKSRPNLELKYKAVLEGMYEQVNNSHRFVPMKQHVSYILLNRISSQTT